jgi:hypothetical protein
MAKVKTVESVGEVKAFLREAIANRRRLTEDCVTRMGRSSAKHEATLLDGIYREMFGHAPGE